MFIEFMIRYFLRRGDKDDPGGYRTLTGYLLLSRSVQSYSQV